MACVPVTQDSFAAPPVTIQYCAGMTLGMTIGMTSNRNCRQTLDGSPLLEHFCLLWMETIFPSKVLNQILRSSISSAKSSPSFMIDHCSFSFLFHSAHHQCYARKIVKLYLLVPSMQCTRDATHEKQATK